MASLIGDSAIESHPCHSDFLCTAGAFAQVEGIVIRTAFAGSNTGNRDPNAGSLSNFRTLCLISGSYLIKAKVDTSFNVVIREYTRGDLRMHKCS